MVKLCQFFFMILPFRNSSTMYFLYISNYKILSEIFHLVWLTLLAITNTRTLNADFSTLDGTRCEMELYLSFGLMRKEYRSIYIVAFYQETRMKKCSFSLAGEKQTIITNILTEPPHTQAVFHQVRIPEY